MQRARTASTPKRIIGSVATLLFLTLFATQVSGVVPTENATLVTANTPFVDRNIYVYGILIPSLIAFAISILLPILTDLTSGIATVGLFISAFLSTRVAITSTFLVDDGAGTVTAYSVSNVVGEPLLSVFLWILFGLSFANFIRILITEFVLNREEGVE